MSGNEIEQLIKLFARLPGLGPRSARRVTLFLIKRRESLMLPIANALRLAAEAMVPCSLCGNIDTIDPCAICNQERRDRSQICVVEDVADLWAMERAGVFSGRYHVLGGTLSAIDGRGPEELNIAQLVERASEQFVEEVILATSATVDGQTTAHYVSDRLTNCDVTISRLAHGVPVGGELDYLDDGTISAALNARRTL
ncbi:MAG: recombination protein RecR [Rhodospirillaceae bacterium]|nr:recombination protein RecR [Rhodospirillaceae bacterium]|tara:strand:+ start:21379 stop:21972 length:594 start_codon:yes stop_codon:yes gene_type:complete